MPKLILELDLGSNNISILGLPLDILVQVDGLIEEGGCLVDLAEKLLMSSDVVNISGLILCTIPVILYF